MPQLSKTSLGYHKEGRVPRTGDSPNFSKEEDCQAEHSEISVGEEQEGRGEDEGRQSGTGHQSSQRQNPQSGGRQWTHNG